MALLVRKRSGKTEKFTLRKVVLSIIRAGGTVELASDVVEHLRSWIHKRKKGPLTTSEVRSEVLKGLSRKNKSVSKAYADGKKG